MDDFFVEQQLVVIEDTNIISVLNDYLDFLVSDMYPQLESFLPPKPRKRKFFDQKIAKVAFGMLIEDMQMSRRRQHFDV